MRQKIVRWLVAIFRPTDKTTEGSGPDRPETGVVRPRLWLRWPFPVRLGGETRQGGAPADPGFDVAEQPDWDGILDSLYWSGYTGTGNPEEMLQRLRKMQDTAVDATRVEYFLRETALRARLDAVTEQRRQDRADEPGTRATIATLQEELRDGKEVLHGARERLLSVHARLTALRHGFPVRQIRERIEAEAALSQTLAENVAATEAVRATAESALLERELARREKAGPAIAEWEAGHAARVRVIRDHSERQGRIVASLRGSGMTERLAGFLVWAGYVGMIVFGWRLGEVLHSRAFPNAATLQGLIAPLARTAYLTFVAAGPKASLLAIGGFFAVWVAGSFLIFFVFDRGLPLFDAAWKGEPKGADGKPKREAGVTYHGILGMLSARVSRRDYAGFLARIPLLAIPALLGLLALLFFAGQRQLLNMEPEFVNPINSLLFGLFGFGTTAGLTACVALLLQPFLTRRAGPSGPGPSVHLAVPIVGFAGLLLLVLLLAGVLTTADVWGGSSLVGPMVMITLNAISLSHGMVYRHLFRDWRALLKEETRLQNEHWAKTPYSLLMPRDLKPQTLFERWNSLHQQVQEAWRAQDASLSQVVDDLPAARPQASTPVRPSNDVPDTGGIAEKGARAPGEGPPDELLVATRVTMLDGRLEPELTSQVVAARAAYHDAREALQSVDDRLSEARTRLRDIEGPRLDEEVSRLENDLRRLTAERASREAEVEARYAALCQEGASAYEGGRQLADRLARVTTGTIRL